MIPKPGPGLGHFGMNGLSKVEDIRVILLLDLMNDGENLLLKRISRSFLNGLDTSCVGETLGGHYFIQSGMRFDIDLYLQLAVNQLGLYFSPV
ncbi:hypothetical protein D3C81_1971490 [compost metagenome]